MQQSNKYCFKHNTTGFSFIEILVVLLLLSIFISFAVPRFFSSRKGVVKKEFFSEFALVISDTLHQAIITKKIHQIFVDLDHHEIRVKQHHVMPDETDKHKQFKAVSPGIFHSQMLIPQQLSIKSFYIGDNDAINQGKTIHDVWFYIMPDGTSQAVIINLQDEEEQANNQFSIAINPFYSQVKLHDAFTKI